MSAINIDQALISIVMNGSLSIDIVHENGGYSTWNGTGYTNTNGVYTPNAQAQYLEIKNFPTITTANSLADSDEFGGLFQGIVRYPVDSGAFAIKTKAEEFLSLFTIGQAISYNGQNVFPVSKNRDGGRIENGFYQIVCRVEYRAFVAR